MNNDFSYMSRQEREQAAKGVATIGSPLWWSSPTVKNTLAIVACALVLVAVAVGYALAELPKVLR